MIRLLIIQLLIIKNICIEAVFKWVFLYIYFYFNILLTEVDLQYNILPEYLLAEDTLFYIHINIMAGDVYAKPSL